MAANVDPSTKKSKKFVTFANVETYEDQTDALLIISRVEIWRGVLVAAAPLGVEAGSEALEHSRAASLGADSLRKGYQARR